MLTVGYRVYLSTRAQSSELSDLKNLLTRLPSTSEFVSQFSFISNEKKNVVSLKVDPLVLNDVNPLLLQRWAHKMDEQFDCLKRDIPEHWGTMTGSSVLQLIYAYQNATIPGVMPVCLRVYIDGLNETLPISPRLDEFAPVLGSNAHSVSDDTVALVFVTVLKEYDLSQYFPPFLRSFMGYVKRNFVCRFGLLGCHYPFHSSLFLIESPQFICETLNFEVSNDECRIAVDRLLLQLVLKWNLSLPKAERCHILMSFSKAKLPLTQAIIRNKWLRISLPDTFILDLRPYHGMTWPKYLAHLRKQNKRVREAPFDKANGIRLIKNEWELKDSQFVVSAHEQVAAQRMKHESTPTMMKPSVDFIEQLKRSGELISDKEVDPLHVNNLARLVQLKLNNHIVASSVLFQFYPSLITSDIAGFDYEKLNQYLTDSNQNIKLYPVKLATVTRMALENKFEFVEFGPTTGESKISIGCTPVPFYGGIYCTSRILRMLTVIIAASHFGFVSKSRTLGD
ncbi:unnamed protein product [Didymodactylos carnosus]|uniref:Uncharacterized protein n=1 Tax=Didymodactylos carnosus TaxID=1234261 RepID=A0A815C3X1_9BILA|nr:unnamed protein product [Didymodactylos carnosus]CAF1372075.1 unnamed protein product [Didymodactylos carnosus]CAF4077775.1 unnamed protein product [Didymodactylos carnosus]CAF4181146.1 unnamed protein product [Didymodactylos carnosus]